MKIKNSRLLLVRQLDKKLGFFSPLITLERPSTGWLYAIRTALNMTLKTFGGRLGISTNSALLLEKREREGAITLNSLAKAGEALGMKLVYGFIAKEGSIEMMIENRAREIATKIIERTATTMRLEDQQNSSERIHLAIEEMTQELKREQKRNIWD